MWLTGPGGTPGDPRIDNDLIEARVREAVDAEPSRRGSRKVESAPDLRVGYQLGFEKKMSVSSVNSDYGYDPYWGPAGYRESRIREHDVGALVIDDGVARPNELVWRGWARDRVRENSSPAQFSAEIRAAVSEILERFPPPPVS